jgi:hypothetical protein
MSSSNNALASNAPVHLDRLTMLEVFIGFGPLIAQMRPVYRPSAQLI